VQTAGASHLKRVSYNRNTSFLYYFVSRQGQEIFFLFSTVSRRGPRAIQYSKGAINFNVFGIFMLKNVRVKLFSYMCKILCIWLVVVNKYVDLKCME